MDAGIIHALAVLETDPDNPDALAQLRALTEGGGNGKGGKETADTSVRRALGEARRIHRERGDFELCARLIDLELGWEVDKERRADLYYEKGKILSDEILREEEAVRCFERVLELRPNDEAVQDTLGHIALVRDNWQKIVKKYLEEAKDSTDRQLTTSLYLSVAEIYAKYKPDEHVEAYLTQALEIEPRNLKAAVRLERLLRAEQRWEDLASLHEHRIEAASSKEERASGYLALAEVQGKRRGLLDEAAEAHKKALGIDPANPRALLALVEYYTAKENWSALICVYENALRARPRGEPETGMHLQIGMLWWKKLGNRESADEYWKRVRKAEPAHPAMLEFYREFHAREPAKLLAVLSQAQKVETNPKRRMDLAVELAALAEKSSGGVEKAIDLWKSVLKLDPGSADASAALKRLYQQTEKWNALLELLKERIEALPKEALDERIERLLEVVAIYRDKLNLDVMVINTYNHILQLRPDHPAALDALAQKYEAMGRWNDLIGVLQRRADVTPEREEKARLLSRVSSLWIDKFTNFNQAVRPLEELYALRPTDPETVARLRDIYTRRRAWRALVDLERKELERLTGTARREKLMEIARLAADRLGDAREAIALWNELLESDENDLEALVALGALYEREKRWLAFVECLRRQAACAPDVKAQVVLLERMGALYAERLNAPNQAIDAYQEIVRRMPSHPKAIRTLRELYAQSQRFAELERLYGEHGQWEELCDVLVSVAERHPETERRIALYARVAEIAQAQLKAPERAAKAYERILSLDGENLAAARALALIYRAQEKWARLLSTYEILLGHAADDGERLALYREIVSVCEAKLGSKGLAFTWCSKAFAVKPDDAGLAQELERLAAEAEAWEELVEIYARAVPRESDPGRQAERYRQMGRLALNRLRRPEDARRHFEAVLERKGDDEEAISVLEQIFTQAQSYPELLAIYKKREARAKDPARRLDLLFKIAWIEEEQLRELAQAIGTYRRILEADRTPQTQMRALRALEKLHAAREEWADLAHVFEKQLGFLESDVDTRLAIENQLGEIYDGFLKQPAEALKHFQAAYALQPTHKPTVSALERWLTEGAQIDAAERLEVAELLLPLYEQRIDPRQEDGAAGGASIGAAKRIAQCLEIMLGESSQDATRLSLLHRLLRLYADQLGDPGKAYDFAGRVFTIRPADAENRRTMAALADTLECQDDLAVRLGEAERKADSAGDLGLARDLAWDLGQLFDVRLSMRDEAEQAYQRVLARAPDDGDAYVALSQLYSVNERWAEMRALLIDKKTRAGDAPVRIGLLFQISDLDEGVLDDQAAAERNYAEALEIAPGDSRDAERATHALDRLYAAQDKWAELDKLLARRIPFALQTSEAMGTPESRAHLTHRRGELHATRLDDPLGAADLWEEVLADEPRHEGARKGLEALMKRPELRQRIARSLEPLYIAEESWSKLALVLGAQREAPEAQDGKVACVLAVRLAEVQEERLGARQLALATWREALRIDPSDANVRVNVERLATLLGRLPELALAWEEAILATHPSDLTLRSELLGKAAELYEFELKDLDKARLAWRRMLELDPSNLHLSRPAAASLQRLHEAQENWADLIGILHRQSEWAENPGDRNEILFRIGRIQEDLLVDPRAAIRTYREVLEGDAEEGRALAALERLHAAQGEWQELTDILRRRLELTREPVDRRELLWLISGLTERELGDPGEAIASYHAILDEHPQDLPTLEALARLYEQEKRDADLLEILERQLALLPEGSQRIGLRMRLCGLLEGFRREAQALERYREVLDLDPRHEGARAGVEKLLDDQDLRLRAAEVLEPHYQAAGELDNLIRLSELWAKYAPDPRERIARLRRIADLREQGAQAVGAFDALARAARFSAGEPDLPSLLDRLERAAAQGGQRTELVALYREIGPDILDASVQERVYLTVAAESHKLGDRGTAREYYRRMLDTAPDHEAALDALEALYLEGQEWEPLFEVYAQRAELAGADDDLRARYLKQLAHLSERSLDRPSEAARAYEQVLELFPADDEASRALEQHYQTTHRHADLAELLEKRLNFSDDIDEAVALRFRLGTIYDEDLSDSDRAVDNYRAALGGDPSHTAAITALEKYLDDPDHRVPSAEVLEPVYAARHDWPKLARTYQIRLEAADDSQLRLLLKKRIARLYEEQLEDLEGAFGWFGKVFREDPTDRTVRDQLGRLAGVLGAWDKLARLYEEYLSDVVGSEDATTVELLRTLASVYHGRLEDVGGAKRCYQRLLQIDAGDELAFHNLEQLLTRAECWKDLIEIWRDAADAALDVERKKTLLFKQAEAQEGQLHDVNAAIDLYRAVLDVDRDDARALTALDRLYTDGKRWRDVVDLIARRLDRADGLAWVALKLRLGAICEAELEDRPQAIDAYEEVLGRQPGHPDAVRSLERLIVDSDHTFRIAQILEPIYRAQDAWQKLVVIYDAELEFIDDKAKRVELLCEIARLHEGRGGDGRLAFGALSQGFAEEVERGQSAAGAADRESELYGELERLARLLVMWRELAHTLESVVEKSYDPELQARVWARVARLKEQHLADPAGAIEAWRKVSQARDEDDEALAALERLLEQEGRKQELVAVLEARSGLVPEVSARIGFLYRAAAIYEEALAQPDLAIATWLKVISLDDDDRAALDALERLYEKGGNHRDLAGTLLRKLELERAPAARRPLRYKLAELQQRGLRDPFAAIEAYKGALADDPQDKDALVALKELYAGERLWADRLEVLDQLARITGDLALSLEAAEVLEKHLGDAEGAIGRYRTLLHAGGSGARAALERLVRDEATRASAGGVLEPYYLERAEHGPLVEVIELRLSAESDPSARRGLYARVAELQEAGLEDLRAAFATWGRVLAEDPGEPGAQRELERLSDLSNVPGDLAAVYEDCLRSASDPEVQRTLAWKLGVLYETKLGDDDRAAAAITRALDLPGAPPEGAEGSERSCLAVLDRLLVRGARWRELSEVLEREAQAVPETEAQAELYHRLGVLRAGELLDLDGALSAFRDALERKPDHAGARAGVERLLGTAHLAEAALDLLEPLYESDGDHEKSLQLAEARLAIIDPPSEKVALLERIADRCEKALFDPERAMGAIARALSIDPAADRLADEMERVARVAGSESTAGEIFEHLLAGRLPSSVGRELGLRTARLWERLTDGRAEARYRAVLELDGESAEAAEALGALDRIYRVRGDAALLADILDRRAARELDVLAKRRYLQEAARLHETHSPEGAVDAWRKVLDVDHTDGAALEALARLYENAGRWQELIDTLQEKARFEEDRGTQAGLKGRVAAIYAERLDNLEQAVAAYRDLLDLQPDALAALEALEELERRRGDFTAVREVLVRRLQMGSPGEAQIPVYKRLVELAVKEHGEHGSLEDAIGYLHEVLALAPDDAEAQRDLAGLLERMGKYHDLVEVLTGQANQRAASGDRDGEIRLLVRVADIWETRLSSPESATEILERILEAEPNNVRALTSLARIYENAHDLERCRATLGRALALAESDPEGGAARAELHYRLGRLEADASGDDAAAPHFRRALDFDRGHVQAGAALEKLARAKGDWAQVAELLQAREGQVAEADLRALYLELANLFIEKLGRAEAALPYLERAVKLQPDDPAVLEPLADLYFAADRLDDALPLYHSLAERMQKARRMKDVGRLRYRMGAIAERRGDRLGALALYNGAHQIDPSHAHTLDALGRLYRAAEDWEKARGIYRKMLLQNLDPQAGVSKADVYLRLGEIHERMGEAPKAVGMYERGLEVEAGHPQLREALARVKQA